MFVTSCRDRIEWFGVFKSCPELVEFRGIFRSVEFHGIFRSRHQKVSVSTRTGLVRELSRSIQSYEQWSDISASEILSAVGGKKVGHS